MYEIRHFCLLIHTKIGNTRPCSKLPSSMSDFEISFRRVAMVAPMTGSKILGSMAVAMPWSPLSIEIEQEPLGNIGNLLNQVLETHAGIPSEAFLKIYKSSSDLRSWVARMRISCDPDPASGHSPWFT